MIVNQSAKEFIDLPSEMLYESFKYIDNEGIEHVHDYFEFTLVKNGEIHFKVNNIDYILTKGSLFFIRPGDVHTKSYTPLHKCNYVNLAFHKNTYESLLQYINVDSLRSKFNELTVIPPVTVSNHGYEFICQRLETLNLIPIKNKLKRRSMLRCIIMEILVPYFFFDKDDDDIKKTKDIPELLYRILKDLNSQENIICGLDYVYSNTYASKEHICRLFNKHLGITPTQYINNLRLNYATNLLTHSDMDITGIALDSGFNNLSHFYHLFKKRYGISPQKMRNNIELTLNKLE